MAVQEAVVRGGRIQHQYEFQVVVAYGSPVNHAVHAVLTVFTCFLWAVVWLIVALAGGERREMVWVDEYGHVHRRRA